MASSPSEKIPLLVTMDLEIAHDHNFIEQKQILIELYQDLKSIGLPITIFATAAAARSFIQQINMLKASGHEIACHGITHSPKEDYSKMSTSDIQTNIMNATTVFKRLFNETPKYFRGSSMTTSAKTQKILIENGYIADFSICSQRLDIINSRGGNPGWLFAPRCPYFPSKKSPYRKGDLPILVIPLSCIGIPFLSGILYIFRFNFMKFFFKVLLKEAKYSYKPIVYLFHSYEFCHYNNKSIKNNGTNRKLLHRLYLQNREQRYKMNFMLFKYMLSHDCIKPMTGQEYIAGIERNYKMEPHV